VSGRQSQRAALLVLVAAALAGAGFVVLLPIQGLPDGALHVEGAVTLRRALGGLTGPAAAYLTWFPVPVPNLLPELALAGLTSFLSPYTAEKVLMVGYVISLPLAFRYALRAVRRDADWLALFAVAVTFNFEANYGFYTFIYSIVLFLVVAGYALRMREGASRRQWGVLGVLLLATYLTHAVGFLEAVIFLAVILVWPRLGSTARTRVASALLVLPVALLVAASLAGLAGLVPISKVGTRWSWFAGTIAMTHGLVSFSRVEFVAGALLAVTLVVAVAGSLRRRFDRADDALLVFALVSVLTVVVAPTRLHFGGSYVSERLALFAALGFALWVASNGVPTVALRRAGVVFAAVAVGLGVVRAPAYADIRNAVNDFSTADGCIARGSTMIQANVHLPNEDHATWKLVPLSEEASRVAAATGGIDLGNVEWSVPYYLLRFKSARDPYRWIPNPPGAVEQVPPNFDLARFERRTGGRVDYVLVTGRAHATAGVLESADWKRLHGQLERMYREVYTSPDGWVDVWERREPRLERAGQAVRASARICGPRQVASPDSGSNSNQF
jgi:hypothetical protein